MKVASARLNKLPTGPVPVTMADFLEKTGSLQITAWAGTLTTPNVPSVRPGLRMIWYAAVSPTPTMFFSGST